MKLLQVGLTLPSLLKYQTIFPENKLSAMFSYARQQPGHYEMATKYRTGLDLIGYDSGTYSMAHSRNTKVKKSITLEGYEAFLKATALPPRKFWSYYLNFDAYYDPRYIQLNWVYQDYLEAAGLNPVPVIHDIRGNEVTTCISRRCPIVAIGSGELRKGGGQALDAATWALHSNGTKVHFLGCTNEALLSSLPVSYCDSSTSTQLGSRAEIKIWLPDEGPLTVPLKDHSYTNPRHYLHNHPRRDDIEDYLWDVFGFEYQDLIGYEKWMVRDVINIHYFVQMEQRVSNAHKEQGILTR